LAKAGVSLSLGPQTVNWNMKDPDFSTERRMHRIMIEGEQPY